MENDISCDDIVQIFETFGPVEKVQINSNGQSRVVFKDYADAADAVEELDSAEIDGRKMKVEFATSDNPIMARTKGVCSYCNINKTFTRNNGKYNWYCKECFTNFKNCTGVTCLNKLYPSNQTRLCRSCLSTNPLKCASKHCQTKVYHDSGYCRACNNV